MYTRKAYATREAPRRGRNDDQPEAREGQAGRSGVAEGFIVPPKLGNASGGKGPQFKTDAIRGEGPGRYVRPTATAPHLDSTKPGCVELIALRPLHPRQRNILSRPERLLILADALVHRGVPIAELQIFLCPTRRPSWGSENSAHNARALIGRTLPAGSGPGRSGFCVGPWAIVPAAINGSGADSVIRNRISVLACKLALVATRQTRWPRH